MTETDKEVSKAQESLLDAFVTASFHDHEQAKEIKEHMVRILGEDGFDVQEKDIYLSPDLKSADVTFVIGEKKRVISTLG